MSDELNFVQRARREKLDALVAARRRAVRVSRSIARTTRPTRVALHPAGSRRRARRVRVAGRIVAWRAHGKTTFAHLADDSGRIQLYFKKDQLGDERIRRSTSSTSATSIGVGGPLFRTRTGEVTVRVDRRSSCSRSRCGRCRSGRKKSSTA